MNCNFLVVQSRRPHIIIFKFVPLAQKYCTAEQTSGLDHQVIMCVEKLLRHVISHTTKYNEASNVPK